MNKEFPSWINLLLNLWFLIPFFIWGMYKILTIGLDLIFNHAVIKDIIKQVDNLALQNSEGKLRLLETELNKHNPSANISIDIELYYKDLKNTDPQIAATTKNWYALNIIESKESLNKFKVL